MPKPKPTEPQSIDAQGRFRERVLYQSLFQAQDWRLKSDDKKRATLEFSASSEEPIERWWGKEVLSHDAEAVNLTRVKRGAMPLLFNHNIDDPIGMIQGARLEKGRLVVEASFFETPRATEIQAMIEGGLRNVSVAYRIGEVVENKQDESFTVTDWEPFEVSIVSVPSDASVGIGRACKEYEVRMVRLDAEPAQQAAPRAMINKEDTAMEEKEKGNGATASSDPAGNDGLPMRNAMEEEAGRVRAIDYFAKANKISPSVRNTWVEQGYSLEQVGRDICDIMNQRAATAPVTHLGLTQTETQRYSLLRAIRCVVDGKWDIAPFEAECSRTIAQKMGRVAEQNRFYIPLDALRREYDIEAVMDLRRRLDLKGLSAPHVYQRDLTVATAGAGGYLVETRNVGFVEMLYNRSVALRMGATRLPGLQGNITIPRQSAAATGFWLATEATAVTESQQTFVQIPLTPKTVGGYVEISRLLLMQSNPAAEGIVSQDLAAVIGVAGDLGVINGSGAAGQPLGIIGTAGIGGVTGTTLGYAGVLDFQVDVAASNVVPLRGGYVSTPAVAAMLMQRSRFTNTDTPLWVGNIWDGSVSGFPAMSSVQMPAANMLFGDWSEVVVGEWGVLEIEVNPFANFPAGIVGVRAMYTMDSALRRPFAFSLATTIT